MNSNDKHIYINIFLHNKGFVPAGVITFNDTLDYSSFSYFSSYMEANLPPLNPATLNWREGEQRHFVVNKQQNKQMLDKTFWEILPQQNDWGNQVLISRFPEYATMNNAQRLYFLGNRIVGGLESFVKHPGIEENINSLDWLEQIHDESIDFHRRYIEKISYIKAVVPLSSYGGARPKCMYQDENDDLWIAKFNLPDDYYDMALAEHVAMEMSRDVGLPTAKSKIITTSKGQNIFLSKRFDRTGDERFHSLSLFALAPVNDNRKHNSFAPGNPGSLVQLLMRRYSDFADMDTIHIVTKFLLDIGLNNTDNHLRNLRMILNEDNKWQLSPMYDIVFNPYNQNYVYNPSGLPLSENYLENPKLIAAMANELSIKPHIIEKQVQQVKAVLNKWEDYCDAVGMKDEDKEQIGKAVHIGLYRKDYEPKKQLTLTNRPVLKPGKI
jgi:hypothetical protein